MLGLGLKISSSPDINQLLLITWDLILGYHCCIRAVRCDEREGDCRDDAECLAGDPEDNTMVDIDPSHDRSCLHHGCLYREVWSGGRTVGGGG